ncbi:MAG: ABC transporter permease [Bacillota bacterium]|nr:ABC transporter permease [Bacillota bacterium]
MTRYRKPLTSLVGACTTSLVLLAIYLFLLAPLLVVVLMAFNTSSYMVFPPEGFTLKWFVAFFRDSMFVEALRTSAVLGVTSAAVATVIGVPAALALVRYRFRGREFLNSLFLAPILFPGVVLAIALLVYYSRLKILGSFIGLVLAHVLVIVPYVIRTVSANLYGVDEALEEASLNLGAGRWRTFFEITLPLIRSGMVSGAIFAFIMSFDELVIALFLSGARMTTLPVRIFNFLEYNSDPTIAAISTVLLCVTLLVSVFVPPRYLGF